MERIKTLEMRGVTRRFGTATALHSFNLTMEGGMFVSLLGPSGCGKSTALNCLAGLLDLSEGQILVNGKPVQNVPAEKRGFGMVFQNYALFPHLNVSRNVAYGMEIRGVPKADRERRTQKALDLVHLSEFGKRFPAQLSGGQQQRLALARTIVLEPAMLLLDEPLSNLDTKLRNEMRVEIKRLHEELNLTTLYVTHDQSEAMSMSDLVLVMRLGRIEQLGTPQDIYNAPRSLYVADFMGYVNKVEVDVAGRDGEEWIVQLPGQAGATLRAKTTLNEAAWQIGDRVLACSRPDETLIDPLPTSNHLRGTVKLVEYMGKSFEGLIQLEGTQQQVMAHSQQPLENGQRVELGIRPERLLLFPMDAIAGAGKPGMAAGSAAAEPALKGQAG
ncbi:MAG: transporter related protein [Chloroflexi bacterium]|jgi:putative spermidine/putrescine transport system ATP-binding protein|nr:transporter related protein [Chloroflexota bacterium]